MNPRLPIKAESALRRESIYLVSDLVSRCPCEYLNLRNFGKLMHEKLIKTVNENGLEMKQCSERPTVHTYEAKYVYPGANLCSNYEGSNLVH